MDEHERGTGAPRAGVASSCALTDDWRPLLGPGQRALRDLVGQKKLIAKIGFGGGVEPLVRRDLARCQIAGTLSLLHGRHDIGTAQVQLIAWLVGKQGIGIGNGSPFLRRRRQSFSIRAEQDAPALRLPAGLVQVQGAGLGVHGFPAVLERELAHLQIGDALHQQLPASGRRFRIGLPRCRSFGCNHRNQKVGNRDEGFRGGLGVAHSTPFSLSTNVRTRFEDTNPPSLLASPWAANSSDVKCRCL